MDNAASSLTPETVLEKMLEFYRSYRANVERGVHRLSQKATEEYEHARLKASRFINAPADSRVVFTGNTTESINLVANGLPWKRGDRVLTTLLEHHSNYIPWLRLRERFGVEVDVAKPTQEGILDGEAFQKAIRPGTKLVAVTHVSNVLGVTLPVREIAKIAHDHGAQLLVDGAQSVPRLKTDVQALRCDYLAFSGHKMLGPTGVGILYLSPSVLDQVEPLGIGGGSIEDVTVESYHLAKGVERFEAGTPPIGEAIGLAAAIDYLERLGLDQVEAHERALTERLQKGLTEIPKVEVYGPHDPRKRVGIVPFNVAKLNPHDVALALDVAANIMVRSGLHCAIPLARELLGRPQGSVRASLYIYNTREEVDKLIATATDLARSIA
ncbi:MAG: cysteine desulfurase [Candidatus Bathyarchaeia archaeon]